MEVHPKEFFYIAKNVKLSTSSGQYQFRLQAAVSFTWPCHLPLESIQRKCIASQVQA